MDYANAWTVKEYEGGIAWDCGKPLEGLAEDQARAVLGDNRDKGWYAVNMRGDVIEKCDGEIQ